MKNAENKTAMPLDGSFSFSFFILHSTFPSGRAVGAVVAQLLYTETVVGSNPSSPTIFQSPVAAQFHFPSAPFDGVAGERAKPDGGLQQIFHRHEPEW